MKESITLVLNDTAWPAWSPDGTKIVFSTTRHAPIEIYTANIDGTDIIQLTDNEYEDAEPTWSSGNTTAILPPEPPPASGGGTGGTGGGGGGGSGNSSYTLLVGNMNSQGRLRTTLSSSFGRTTQSRSLILIRVPGA